MDKKFQLPDKIKILQKQNCFKDLSDSEIETLAGLLKEVTFKKDETIVNEGDPVDSVYFVMEGSADVRHVRIKQGALDVQSIATLHAGETIGLNESGFYSLTGLRTATVTANEPILSLRLSVAAFHGFALAYSHVNDVMKAQHQPAPKTNASEADKT
jgi:signal-transduction protein with cAMP-binding, CBS, and nucleotidyltransferase domain